MAQLEQNTINLDNIIKKINTLPNGTDVSGVTATASDVLSPKIFVDANGEEITGIIPSKAAATYTPSTKDQTISASTYLTGTQTIKGDNNLKAENIKSGVSIFDVVGSYTGDGVKFKTGTTGTITATYANNSNIRYSLSISNIGFVPTLLVVRLNATASNYTRQYEVYFHVMNSDSTTFTTYWELTFDDSATAPARIWYEEALTYPTSVPGSAVTATTTSFTATDSINLVKDSGISSVTSAYRMSIISWKAYGG